MKKLEVLQNGSVDDLDLLSDVAMNRLKGGVSCKKGYSADYCECGYNGGTIKQMESLRAE